MTSANQAGWPTSQFEGETALALSRVIHFVTRRIGSVASLPALPSDPGLQGFRALHTVAGTSWHAQADGSKYDPDTRSHVVVPIRATELSSYGRIARPSTATASQPGLASRPVLLECMLSLAPSDTAAVTALGEPHHRAHGVSPNRRQPLRRHGTWLSAWRAGSAHNTARHRFRAWAAKRYAAAGA